MSRVHSSRPIASMWRLPYLLCWVVAASCADAGAIETNAGSSSDGRRARDPGSMCSHSSVSGLARGERTTTARERETAHARGRREDRQSVGKAGGAGEARLPVVIAYTTRTPDPFALFPVPESCP